MAPPPEAKVNELFVCDCAPLECFRLIWSLNRFLAAAAKKYYPARIIIVIDGVFAIKVGDV